MLYVTGAQSYWHFCKSTLGNKFKCISVDLISFIHKKTISEKLQNTRNDNVEDASSIVVKELKGRNVTIVKANTGNKTPKTPAVTNTKVKNEDIENEIIF